MTIETELKFIILPQAVLNLVTQVTMLPHQYIPVLSLRNIYFDTETYQLRDWGMGLRIRRCGEQIEMTIKTVGQVIGGLHQRAEYNVNLSLPELDIQRFPADIWPAGCDIAALQHQLRPCFSTCFRRERWLIQYRQSRIEVALDQGEIISGALSDPLHEIELELKSGHSEDLLLLASELAGTGGVRQGRLSKAARGYALLQGNPQQQPRLLPLMRLPARATVEQGMSEAFKLALEQWQYHEEMWLCGDKTAIREVLDALMAVRQLFTLFGSLIPRKASSELRQHLSELQQILTTHEPDANVVCFSPCWLQIQLRVTHWLFSQRWRDDTDASANRKLQGSFKRFADIKLGRVGADLKKSFTLIHHPAQYQDKAIHLTYQLLSVQFLSGAYNGTAVETWRGHWQRLLLAIRHRQGDKLEFYRREAMKQPPFWCNNSGKKASRSE